jgi:hypothetical protein
MQELAPEVEVPGNAVDRVAADGQPDRLEMDADLMRPSGLEPHLEQRARPRRSRSSNHVTASRGVSVSRERRVRSRRSRPIGAVILPVRERGSPTTSAR